MNHVPLFLAPPHACSYLAEREAQFAFVDPHRGMDVGLYSALANLGFRRSGDMVYRPHCGPCRACTPVRVPAARFTPNRNQSRVARRNKDLHVAVKLAVFFDEHFRLYKRYLHSHHGDGDMAATDPDQYMDFVTSGWSDTVFVEFREDTALLAVAVVDRLERGLSAVYTYFDPLHESRSLGVHAVLWQIEEARRLRLDWVHLGYWIAACRKMRYKDQYRPIQALVGGQWLEYEKGEKIPG